MVSILRARESSIGLNLDIDGCDVDDVSVEFYRARKGITNKLLDVVCITVNRIVRNILVALDEVGRLIHGIKLNRLNGVAGKGLKLGCSIVRIHI
jgi:hypothetical protein